MRNFIKTKMRAATLVLLAEAGSRQGRGSRGHTCAVGCVQVCTQKSCQRGEASIAGNLSKPEMIEMVQT